MTHQPFLEIVTPNGLAYIRKDSVEWLGQIDPIQAGVRVAGVLYALQGEDLDSFKKRLGIAWSPSPNRKGEQ